MIIETKFNYGNKVYSMIDNKVAQFTILNTFIECKNCGQDLTINYSIESTLGSRVENENKLFKTKEELIKSL